MEIILPDYIRLQMSERGIPEDWVRETMTSPEQVVESRSGRRIAQHKYFDPIKDKEYILRVIFIEEGNRRVGITTYLSSNIKKYWR